MNLKDDGSLAVRGIKSSKLGIVGRPQKGMIPNSTKIGSQVLDGDRRLNPDVWEYTPAAPFARTVESGSLPRTAVNATRPVTSLGYKSLKGGL